jgi:hypothetical protein
MQLPPVAHRELGLPLGPAPAQATLELLRTSRCFAVKPTMTGDGHAVLNA